MMALDELVNSLLYEGYALYPYTPGAVKNALPLPLGLPTRPDTRREAGRHSIMSKWSAY